MPRKPRGEFDIEVGIIAWIAFWYMVGSVIYTTTHVALWFFNTFF